MSAPPSPIVCISEEGEDGEESFEQTRSSEGRVASIGSKSSPNVTRDSGLPVKSSRLQRQGTWQSTGGYQLNKFQSKMSKSNFSLADHYRHGVYVQDTPFQKMIAIGYIFVAVILNLLLLLAGWTMSNGVILSIPPSALKLCLGTILELTVLILNTYTLDCMTCGVSIYLAMLLTSEEGYALVACGFMQTSSFGRLKFAYNLPRTSPHRKKLLILSLMWVAVEFVKIRAPITATGFTASLVSSVGTPIDCIVFSSDINFMSDRTYPTIESIEGTMNLMMSKSLGCLRSTERCFANKTQFLFGPQLVGAVGEGDSIIGAGFQMSISSNCSCFSPNSHQFPTVPKDVLSSIRATMLSIDEEEYVIQPALALIHTNRQANSSTVASSIILVDPRYCMQDQFPVCDTSIRDIQDVEVISSFETDGSTASIALVRSKLHRLRKQQTVTGTAFSNALATIIPSEKIFTFVLTGFLEASFLGDSRNSSVVKDIQQLEPAMEAFYSVILRAGIQRSFDSKGKYCPRYYIRQDQMLVFLNFNGSLAMFLVASIQLILSFISLMLATCWIFCPLPLSPAIRTVRDPKYFLTMIATSSFAHLLYGTANAPVSEIWSRLNVNARIGEPFYTVDDEVGIIVLGRPDEVQPIQNDRKYR